MYSVRYCIAHILTRIQSMERAMMTVIIGLAVERVGDYRIWG